MWLLKDPEGNIFYLRSASETNVGRKFGDIILAKDSSVSKKHAILAVHLRQTGGAAVSTLIVKDTNSKYGSTINNDGRTIKVTKEGCIVKHQDKITFGLQENTFSVFHVPLNTVVSKLKNEDNTKLTEIMTKLDGIIHSSWNEGCTHLTTAEATLTEKVVLALALCIPVVGLKYWEKVLEAVENNQPLPNTTEFSLDIKESAIVKNVSLSPNPRRKVLFTNLTFVHFSAKQQRNYSRMISVAGGKSVLYSNIKLDNLCGDNVIVLELTTQESQYITDAVTAYNSTINILKKGSRRTIGETEIPLAILYCSTEQHCNPKYNFTKLLDVPGENKAVNNSAVLKNETQDVQARTKSVKVINETKESLQDSSIFRSQSKNASGLPDKKASQPEMCKVKETTTREIPETIESMETSQTSQTSQRSTQGSSIFSKQLWDDVKSVKQTSTQKEEPSSSKKRKENDSEIVAVGAKKRCLIDLSFDEDEISTAAKKTKAEDKKEVDVDDWGFTKNENDDDPDFEDFNCPDDPKKKKKAAAFVEKVKVPKNVEKDQSAEKDGDKDINFDLRNLHIEKNKEKLDKLPGKRKRLDDHVGEGSEKKRKGSDEEKNKIENCRSHNNSPPPRETFSKQKRSFERNGSKCNVSFLRAGIDLHSNTCSFGKTFKKVYNNIPKERIRFNTN